MVEVKVIIVTHGNPRPSGTETAPQGDSGEKRSGMQHIDMVCTCRQRDIHSCEYACVPSRTHKRVHTETWHTGSPPGLGLIDL